MAESNDTVLCRFASLMFPRGLTAKDSLCHDTEWSVEMHPFRCEKNFKHSCGKKCRCDGGTFQDMRKSGLSRFLLHALCPLCHQCLYDVFCLLRVLIDVETPAAHFHCTFCASILPPLPHYSPGGNYLRVSLCIFCRKSKRSL